MAQQQQRYKVLERIASGGMAEVFRAESAGLEGFKKVVAIKRVLPHLSEKKQFIGMFLDEARVSAYLSHSNCVQVFDIGVGDNTFFIVMEYVDGCDLKAIVEYQRRLGQAVPVEEACLICVRICEGLSYAHELMDGKGRPLNIVHRDLSPPNVLLTRYGEVKIVDFGLAKANSQLEKSEPGIIKGKFSYLSPEAAQGLSVDARTDIFACGIMLWELLAGRRLFLGDTDLETVRQVQRAEIPSIRQFNPNAPPELERVLARALARDPKQRYQTARELGRDLNQILFHLPRAVSSFDIARLVEPIRSEREFKNKQSSKRSIIGSLIDEALFEFTSLENENGDRSSATSTVGATPLNLGSFGGAKDWGKELGALDTDQSMPTEFEAGNLSALEGDSPFSLSGSMQAASAIDLDDRASAEPEPEPAPPAAATVEIERPAPPAQARSHLITLVVVVALVLGAAGAYFGGLLPGH